MGLHDRPYWRDSQNGGGLGGLRFYWPRPTRAVVGLMIACGALFLAQLLAGEGRVEAWLALGAGKWYEGQRLLTFQFLHAGPGHLFFNMMGLYFFGPPLEKEWGTERFLAFYLACGVAGGAAFLLLGQGAPAGAAPTLVGASGGVLACVAACAVLMPQMRILVIPIRWATAIMVVIYVLSVAGSLGRYGYAAIGDAAHLGGMLAGALWAMGARGRGAAEGEDRPGLFGRARGRLRRGAWQRKQEREDRRRVEVDRILDKVHREGIGSLTGREKKTLQDETRRQKEEEGGA